MPTLTGTEQLWVVPVQANGQITANQEQCSTGDIAQLASSGTVTGIIATPDNGTTQTLTGPMVVGNADFIFHTSAGGATPSLTMPTAATIIAGITNFSLGDSYILRIINTNSGTATIVTNSGITLSGLATLALNTTRDFLITMTGAATLSMVNVGSGTL